MAMTSSRTATALSRVAVVFVTAMLALGASGSRRETPLAAAADSLDLLLLSTPRLTTLSIRGNAMHIDGRPAGLPQLDVRVEEGELRIERRHFGSVRITCRGPIEIVSGGRRRTISGTLALRVRDDALTIVARVAVTDYLAGTLASEASLDDPRAYLVALSVLQRNYVATHRSRHGPDADLCDNTHCQLFNAAAGARAHAIVAEAAGLAVSQQRALPCYYSANCGGSSLTPGEVWGRSEPGYSSVRCDDCRSDRWRRWSRSVPATALAIEALVGAPATPFVDDDFKIRVGRVLGFNVVPSNTIDRIERRGSHFVISGRGFGHRVGLCQAGARQLARRGRDAAAILARYFPSATVAITSRPTRP
jgi:stage II sporulation protein D